MLCVTVVCQDRLDALFRLAPLALCQHILPVDVQPAPTGFFEDGVVRDAGKIKIRRNYSTALQVASGLNSVIAFAVSAVFSPKSS